MLSIRDPIHGFIRADELETALIQSRPMQRLRFIRQLGLTFLIFPGAEHSRFSHVLGTMHLAGRVYDALAAKSDGLLPVAPTTAASAGWCGSAALLHDIGHAPLQPHGGGPLRGRHRPRGDDPPAAGDTAEIEEIFARHGDGLDAEEVHPGAAQGERDGRERLLSEIVTSELDVDKMDYLRRDSLYCGVQYGSYDLERLIDTVVPIDDPSDGEWRIGVDHGGVHALEALVMARYYMFTQVYFNVTGKVMELHFNEWLRAEGRRWPAEPEAFLEHDDVSVCHEMRRSRQPPRPGDRPPRALLPGLRDQGAPDAGRAAAVRGAAAAPRGAVRTREPAGRPLGQGPPPAGREAGPGAPLRRLAPADGRGERLHLPHVADRQLPGVCPADPVRRGDRGGAPRLGSGRGLSRQGLSRRLRGRWPG